MEIGRILKFQYKYGWWRKTSSWDLKTPRNCILAIQDILFCTTLQICMKQISPGLGGRGLWVCQTVFWEVGGDPHFVRFVSFETTFNVPIWSCIYDSRITMNNHICQVFLTYNAKRCVLRTISSFWNGSNSTFYFSSSWWKCF